VSVTVTEIAQDQQGNYRFQGTATLGEGSRVVLGVDPDRDTARTIAEGKAGKEERYLAAVETHDPDDLPDMPREGVRVLRAPDGTLVDATEATVPALLAAGYTEAQGVAQRTDEAPPVRRRGRPRTQATRTLDSDDAARAAAEADLDPPVGDGDEM
jgi:hypothetical protein